MINATVESIAFGGEGIVREEGRVIFVPFTAPQDRISLEILSQKKNFARGKCLALTTPSPLRTSPRCRHFGTCGGCQLQHLNYDSQLQAKRSFVLDALKRIGKVPIDDLTITPAHEQWHYRRHIRLSLRKENTGFSAGYMGWENDRFVPVDECPLFLPSEALEDLHSLLRSLFSTGIDKGSVRLIKTEGEKLLLAFQFSPRLPQNADQIKKIPRWQGILMDSPHGKWEWGDTRCFTELLGLKARFSPFGFLQNHPEQSLKLYAAILAALPIAHRSVLDLYCGIGLTSLLFGRAGKDVIGVETHPETIALAKENATLNNLPSISFFEGKAETLGVSLLKQQLPDTVLCNPPRTGLAPELLEALVTVKPRCLLYVSCMPSTLARDLQKLLASGYQIDHIQSFDMFPQTTHVETLVKLM